MSKTLVQNLLKRINYLEAEIEIQKQIAFSTQSGDRKTIECLLTIIAEKKKEISDLRNQIREEDPEEYEKIIIFEKAVEDFKKLASKRSFQNIIGRNVDEDCALELTNGKQISCLVKACDANSNWTVITLSGEIRDYPAEQVVEKYKPPIIH
jgi:hypothetical protein